MEEVKKGGKSWFEGDLKSLEVVVEVVSGVLLSRIMKRGKGISN